MIYFTSDTHYGHANIIKYSERPFKDTVEMNETMIRNWNEIVKPGDQIYHLGDFGFMQEPELDKILSRLNGQKFLIWGNHDQVIKKSKALQAHFAWCRDYYEIKTEYEGKDQKIVLCHYPMVSWNKMHRGSWMVHGHCHGNLKYPFKGRIWDAGVDPNGFKLITVADLGKRFKDVVPTVLDHHTAREM